MSRIVVMCGCFIILLCFTGCNKGKGLKTEYVEGVVTLNGTPQADVSVRFVPIGSTGESAGGLSNEKGVYKLSSINGDPEKGALEGEYKIVLSKSEVTEYAENDPNAPKDNRGNSLRSTSKQLLPKEYTDAKTTPLTYTVVKGKQTHDIEIISN